MSGWAIFLTIVLAVPLVAAVIFFCMNGLNALHSAKAGDYGKAILFAAIALVPAALFFGINAAADIGAASREKEVAAFRRTPLPHDRPRTLEIYDRGDHLAAIALASGRFDRVFIIDALHYPAQARDKVWAAKLKPGDGCQVRANAYWDATLGRSGYKGELGSLDRCIERTEAGAASDAAPGDAIIFLAGAATTMNAKDRPIWGSGNYEIRMRRGGEDLLVDYWEVYYYNKLGLFGMYPAPPKPKKGERPFHGIRWLLEKIERADGGPA